MRNAYAQHAVAPYGVRARNGAPVATPLDWSEVEHRGRPPELFTTKSVPRRLVLDGDPWSRVRSRGGSIASAARRLGSLKREAA